MRLGFFSFLVDFGGGAGDGTESGTGAASSSWVCWVDAASGSGIVSNEVGSSATMSGACEAKLANSVSSTAS